MVLNKEQIPNAKIINPGIRLIHVITFWLTFLRNKVMPSLKSNHQAAEPKKTPRTNAAA